MARSRGVADRAGAAPGPAPSRAISLALTPEQRSMQLQRLADDAGQGWARSLLAVFTQEKRPVEGGWPGTKREARVLLADAIAASTQDLSGANSDELERCAVSLYSAARHHWLKRQASSPRQR
jgi:hypothetical protein